MDLEKTAPRETAVLHDKVHLMKIQTAQNERPILRLFIPICLNSTLKVTLIGVESGAILIKIKESVHFLMILTFNRCAQIYRVLIPSLRGSGPSLFCTCIFPAQVWPTFGVGWVSHTVLLG